MPSKRSNLLRTIRRLGPLGLCSALALASFSVAAVPSEEPLSTRYGSGDCAEATVSLEVDTVTGDVHRYDPQSQTMIVVDDKISVYFDDTLERVTLELEFSTDEWDVTVSSAGATLETIQTVGGKLSYSIESDHDDYTFSSALASSGASSVMAMAPVPPGDIILMPEPTCPPED